MKKAILILLLFAGAASAQNAKQMQVKKDLDRKLDSIILTRCTVLKKQNDSLKEKNEKLKKQVNEKSRR